MVKEAIVWGLPNCVKCNQTMFWLDNHNIPYTEEDLTLPENAENLAYLKSQGHTSAPIVEVIKRSGYDGTITALLDRWSGFFPKSLEEHFA